MIGSNCASSQHFYSIIHSCYCRAISSFFHTISKWVWVWLECSLDSLWWDLHTLCMETMVTSSSLFKSIKFTLNSVHSTFDASIDDFNSWFGTRMMRLLLSHTQFTVSSDWDWIPLSATSIIFESNSFGDMVNVDLSNFISLQSVVFREGSFASPIVLRITGNHHSII